MKKKKKKLEVKNVTRLLWDKEHKNKEEQKFTSEDGDASNSRPTTSSKGKFTVLCNLVLPWLP